ncbi:chemotaxis protein CheW [Herbaspirillum sp. RTI4]|uniref:chemotaxis protein CheW n=1 Tax=Herbaspirillum sp. RTI4 TaxID=3048640 RepID=UPI002AB4B0C9|nr:chemotaxis protein CheW [Herbaspirillum sp. RTI4]MDY7579170.1 chemotaxis protein CheW [Herbaspirillum sp. RTI4]MEA9981251.1 chemotaxis protein CheW [Herbaspirillum sp. RTI4]
MSDEQLENAQDENSRMSVSLEETDSAPAESFSDIHQFVTFIVGDEVFAVDMAPVQEIIRVPDIVRVPLSPPTLEGLANLRGKLLPIISLSRIFGFPERAYDDATRAVVIDQGAQSLGFVVDRVVSVVGVDPRHIEGTESISANINTDLVSGVLKDISGYPMIMVLDFARLIVREFSDAGSRSDKQINDSHEQSETDATVEETISDELHLVNFEVANQEYAIAITDVQEIVQVPELIVKVPHSESHVLGIMTLRNRLLPLVSLRRMFGLPNREVDESSRIVVVALGADSVGVVMDSVNEVLSVPLSEVDLMPGMLAREGNLSEITQICRLDGGKRLVSILSVGSMFRHAAIKEALTTVDTMSDEQNIDENETLGDVAVEDEEQVVIFMLGKEEFGVPIDSVQEIVRVSESLTRVPKAPPEVEGVINLRGAVLPVMDLRRRLGLEPLPRTDQQRIMVFLIEGVRTGFIVDSVLEVLKIHKATIEAAPRLSSTTSQLLARMANLEKQKRMVQLLDPSHLIEQPELEALIQLAAA